MEKVYDDGYISIYEKVHDRECLAIVRNHTDDGIDIYLGLLCVDEYGDETPLHISPRDHLCLSSDDENDMEILNALKSGMYDLMVYTFESERKER